MICTTETTPNELPYQKPVIFSQPISHKLQLNIKISHKHFNKHFACKSRVAKHEAHVNPRVLHKTIQCQIQLHNQPMNLSSCVGTQPKGKWITRYHSRNRSVRIMVSKWEIELRLKVQQTKVNQNGSQVKYNTSYQFIRTKI